MPQNRLQLDFQLETREERTEFVKQYLSKIRFQPNEAELDMIAKYILWGKNSEGLNGRQEGLELETRYGTWDSTHLESLDALIENPNFSETAFRSSIDPPARIPRETFSRAKARQSAPPHILHAFEILWHEIDYTELLLNFYDLAHSKRSTPPRDQLLSRFSQPEISQIQSNASQLKPYEYLKLKHKLVELRREQYTYKDSYAEPRLSQPTFNQSESLSPTFGTEIPVYPVGLSNDSALYSKIFCAGRFPAPDDFTPEELSRISTLLWMPPPPSKLYFDFGNVDHLYKLFGMWDELLSAISTPFSNLDLFTRTALYYKDLAQLEPLLDDILRLKVEKKQNQDIASFINKKYGKNYRANYISTLYCKKCLALIAAAAKKHREVLENIFFPENFKKCKDCGRILLMDEDNFVRRARSNDGFSPRCKKCEKNKRDRKKEV